VERLRQDLPKIGCCRNPGSVVSAIKCENLPDGRATGSEKIFYRVIVTSRGATASENAPGSSWDPVPTKGCLRGGRRI